MSLFFLYEELLLYLSFGNGPAASLACLILSSLAAGCLTDVLLLLIPSKKPPSGSASCSYS